ncbi:MAG: hypothetical protein R6T99_01375 [Bacteroidales bacterium]
MKKIRPLWILLIAMLIAGISCDKDDEPVEVITPANYVGGEGFFIINEGNFGQANGSLSFFNLDNYRLYENIFQSVNNRPIGDIPSFMGIRGNVGYIVVNNSAGIEIVDLNTFESLHHIGGLGSPREILILNDEKAYVTDLAQSGLHILDLISHTVSGTVELGKSSENIILADQKVFVSNWSDYYVPAENNTVQVIDPLTDTKVSEIPVTKEPNSMVRDKNGKLWVLCSGGFLGEEVPALYRINPATLDIEGKIEFSSSDMAPSKLNINASGETLYYLNGQIFKMSIQATEIPSGHFIEYQDGVLYSLFVDPDNSHIIASDAIDFQQPGKVFIYREDGSLMKEFTAGIIPGSFAYRH